MEHNIIKAKSKITVTKLTAKKDIISFYLLKVSVELTKAIEREDDDEIRDMFAEDANDYKKLSRLVSKGKKMRATNKYEYMDTAARELVYDYLDHEEADAVLVYFGYEV